MEKKEQSMKKQKKEKTKKVPMKDIFYEYTATLKEAIASTSDALKAYANKEDQAKLKFIEETIRLEKKQDRIRETLTDRIFSKETMVFSREDRLNLVDDLDDIVDVAEIVVRKLKMYNPSIPDAFKPGFLQIAEELKQIGAEMELLIQAVLTDFSKAKTHIITINNLRRNIRETHWDLLEKTYQLKDDFIRFYYFQKLIKSMCTLADETEELADEIYALICKYSL